MIPAHYSSIRVIATELNNILLRIKVICSLIWFVVRVQALHYTGLWIPVACHNIGGKLKNKDTYKLTTSPVASY